LWPAGASRKLAGLEPPARLCQERAVGAEQSTSRPARLEATGSHFGVRARLCSPVPSAACSFARLPASVGHRGGELANWLTASRPARCSLNLVCIRCVIERVVSRRRRRSGEPQALRARRNFENDHFGTTAAVAAQQQARRRRAKQADGLNKWQRPVSSGGPLSSQWPAPFAGTKTNSARARRMCPPAGRERRTRPSRSPSGVVRRRRLVASSSRASSHERGLKQPQVEPSSALDEAGELSFCLRCIHSSLAAGPATCRQVAGRLAARRLARA
jgi:hypothetical protein